MTKKVGRLVTTYQDLENNYRSWEEGHIPLLALLGGAGHGKTSTYERRRKIERHVFRGRTSARTIYETIRDRPDLPIVFDDIHGLLRDPDSIDLVKQLCETKQKRVIRWNTNSIIVDKRSFTCRSIVMLILNEIPRKNENVNAILDRFDIIHFVPSKNEIIDKMRTFANDQKDVDLIDLLVDEPSLRTLYFFEQWKEAPSLDEVRELLGTCGVANEIYLMVNTIVTTPKKQRIRTFQEKSGKSHSAAKKYWERNLPKVQQIIDVYYR